MLRITGGVLSAWILLATNALAQPPFANDDCAAALPIGTPFFGDFDTIGATTDGPDLAPFCDPSPGADDQIYDDLWYCWSPSFDGPHRLEIQGFAEPVRVAIYEGCTCPVTPSTVLACDETAMFSPLPTTLNFDAIAGLSYAIRVGTAMPGAP
ncbi:MAG: hypothetical protein KDC38_16080, partial [Planctomycetes bacterium]|nr:hypothetical protein [Planctomycetota bacterium]